MTQASVLAVQAVLVSYANAARAKDISAFMALYDEDTRIFDLWESWEYAGAGPWRETVTQWFTSLGAENLEVEFSEVRITAADGFGAVSAIVTYASIAQNGERLREMQNRLSWVLGKQHGSWRIIHEHTSAPVNPEDLKVILQK